MDDKPFYNYAKFQDEHKYSLEKGVLIGEETVPFEKFDLDEIPVSIYMPKNFEKMSNLSIKLKYPSLYPPNIIYTSPDETINFLFSIIDTPFSKNEIEERSNEYRNLIKKMNPTYTFYEKNLMEREYLQIGWFDYTSIAIDSDIYNWLYLTDLDDKLFLGGFNCISTERRMWSTLLIDIMSTFEIR